MKTIIHRMHCRARWLAAAAAIGLAVPAMAQTSDAGQLQLLPPKPAAPARSGVWPDFPPLDPPPSGASRLPARPDELPAIDPTPRPGTVTTSPHLPPFSGFGRGGAQPQPGSFPQPDAPPAKVWTVAPTSPPAGDAGAAADRSPRDFGNGWKGVMKDRLIGRDTPAAALAAPRSVSFGPRPSWSWHGYDTYNQGRPTTSELSASNPNNAADMGPYMKYAHLWRPSNVSGLFTQESGRVGAAPVTPLAPAAASDAAPRALTPSITVPADAAGRPGAIQTSSFHDAPPALREPLPPLPPVSRPKTVVLPPPEVGNAHRLPLAAREKISQLCAGKCRNLAVDMQSPIRLCISFLVKDQVEADMLTNMLGTLPELAPYKVDFEVQIGQ